MGKKDRFSGIPPDIVEKIKTDYYGEEKNLNYYHAIMARQCDLTKDERIAFIRAVLAERPHYGLGNVLTEFMKYAKKHQRAASLEQKREVFVEIERIIGNSCYNGNIQNYSSWGVLESEGREFRYPLTYHDERGSHKCYTVSKDVPMKALLTGHYAFGANQLYIFEAIQRIVSYLEAEYGLDLTRKKKKR